MAVEISDLERGMLGHGQLLQVLIAQMTEAEPKFFDQLRAGFARDHTLGRDEQDFTGSSRYAMRFVRRIEILREAEDPGEGADAAAPDTTAPGGTR